MKRFELLFTGEADPGSIIPKRYKRIHGSLDSAKKTARAIWESLQQEHGGEYMSHEPIVYGPGCGRDGMSVRPW